MNFDLWSAVAVPSCASIWKGRTMNSSSALGVGPSLTPLQRRALATTVAPLMLGSAIGHAMLARSASRNVSNRRVGTRVTVIVFSAP